MPVIVTISSSNTVPSTLVIVGVSGLLSTTGVPCPVGEGEVEVEVEDEVEDDVGNPELPPLVLVVVVDVPPLVEPPEVPELVVDPAPAVVSVIVLVVDVVDPVVVCVAVAPDPEPDPVPLPLVEPAPRPLDVVPVVPVPVDEVVEVPESALACDVVVEDVSAVLVLD